MRPVQASTCLGSSVNISASGVNALAAGMHQRKRSAHKWARAPSAGSGISKVQRDYEGKGSVQHGKTTTDPVDLSDSRGIAVGNRYMLNLDGKTVEWTIVSVVDTYAQKEQ